MAYNAKRLILIATLIFLGWGAARASDKIWVGLYFGENRLSHPHAVFAPESLREGLEAVFGFHNYELVKAREIELEKDWEQWVIPRRDLFIRVQPLPAAPGEPKVVYFELYKDGFIVAKGRYEPHPGTPLFINGPDFHQGRFIFVLEAR